MKIVTIIGARPQFIKAATVSRAIALHNRNSEGNGCIQEVIVHTGQHYDANMSQVFFNELHIPRPDYNLEVGSGDHGEQTAAMLERIEKVLLKERPNFVLVYGDTNSTLAGAVAAVKLHIPSVHVEAGLRSFNRHMPEEINRIIADHTCNILVCPTETAVRNLENERIGRCTDVSTIPFNQQKVYLAGDVMYDSVLFNADLAEEKSRILKDLKVSSKGFALATLHRAENTDCEERLRQIMAAFASIGSIDFPLVLPLHPRTRKRIAEVGVTFEGEGTRIVDPVGYLDMMQLEKHARVILTDSGGVQKEAFFMGVPCITMRDQTEWMETVDLGWNYIAGADSAKIVEAFNVAKETSATGSPFRVAAEDALLEKVVPYGDGHAAEKIVRILTDVDIRGVRCR